MKEDQGTTTDQQVVRQTEDDGRRSREDGDPLAEKTRDLIGKIVERHWATLEAAEERPCARHFRKPS